MTRNEFERMYLEEYGEMPDPETIALHFGEDIRSEWNPSQQRTSRQYYSGSNELLSELQGVVSSIAENAKVAVRNKESIIRNKPYLSEFGFMALIFFAKASIYFLMKNSYESGFDLSNI
ncbi:MAG: hypothetical protein NUK65_03540 [Firmicutes bacterium]|nr:hypothetical protein [Bacillota bacterium]